MEFKFVPAVTLCGNSQSKVPGKHGGKCFVLCAGAVYSAFPIVFSCWGRGGKTCEDQEMWEVVNLLAVGSFRPQVRTYGSARSLLWVPVIGELSVRTV